MNACRRQAVSSDVRVKEQNSVFRWALVGDWDRLHSGAQFGGPSTPNSCWLFPQRGTDWRHMVAKSAHLPRETKHSHFSVKPLILKKWQWMWLFLRHSISQRNIPLQSEWGS
jgi:hypothetical protein